MAQITAEMVRELREATNVGMMECKRALEEAGGDRDKAIRVLRERGMAVAAKKASRVANQGLIGAAVTPDGRAGALVEVNCETDFVAKNADFQAFIRDLAAKAAARDGQVAEFAAAEVAARIQQIGENIVVRRNVRYVVQGTGLLSTYIHLAGKIGVMIEMGCEKQTSVGSPTLVELARDLTLHITACSPRALSRTEVAPELVAAEREIYAKQMQGKPAQILDKIVTGKLGKFYAQVCLLEQGFVRDPDTSVTALLEAKSKELGDTITVRRYVRYQVGE